MAKFNLLKSVVTRAILSNTQHPAELASFVLGGPIRPLGRAWAEATGLECFYEDEWHDATHAVSEAFTSRRFHKVGGDQAEIDTANFLHGARGIPPYSWTSLPDLWCWGMGRLFKTVYPDRCVYLSK